MPRREKGGLRLRQLSRGPASALYFVRKTCITAVAREARRLAHHPDVANQAPTEARRQPTASGFFAEAGRLGADCAFKPPLTSSLVNK